MRQAFRYANLASEIAVVQPRRIVEIGTCKGDRAELMIRTALRFSGTVEYIGFDLFEPPPDEEFSARAHPWPVERVMERLDKLGAGVRLVKGNTRETLAAAGLSKVDFVFLDGGHSDETVRSDFNTALEFIRPGAPIMCDDYWNYPGGGGCNALVDGLDPAEFEITKLEPVDEFAKPFGILRTQIVKVRKR